MDPAMMSAAARAGETAANSAANELGGLLTRLLGPSADVIGQDWAERLRRRNMTRLLAKTQAHGGGEGFASPRVASQVFEAAEYADSEVVAEYLSGVLASARRSNGQDDSGVQWSAIIARLSSAQLRLHYLLYASVRSAVLADPPQRANELHRREIVLPFDQLIFHAHPLAVESFADALTGLMREGLIGDGYSYGPVAYVFEKKARSSKVTFPHERAVRVRLSIHGLRLYLWGLGAGRADSDIYIDPKAELTPAEPETMPTLVEDANFVEAFLAPREPDPPAPEDAGSSYRDRGDA